MLEQKTISVKEFRMWLEGVEEMQEPGWVPSAQQWQRIREKLNTIADASATRVGAPTQQAPAQLAPSFAPAAPQHYTQPMPMTPPPSSSLGLGTPPSITGRAPVASSPAIPVKTPDIDTSSGEYTSSFA